MTCSILWLRLIIATLFQSSGLALCCFLNLHTVFIVLIDYHHLIIDEGILLESCGTVSHGRSVLRCAVTELVGFDVLCVGLDWEDVVAIVAHLTVLAVWLEAHFCLLAVENIYFFFYERRILARIHLLVLLIYQVPVYFEHVARWLKHLDSGTLKSPFLSPVPLVGQLFVIFLAGK